MVTKLERVPQRQYRAAEGAGFDDKAAQRYGRFLERKGLGKRPIPPEEIVELARPEKSPIHERFEWDDSAAAAAHRTWQARNLVNHIVYTAQVPGGAKVEARAFHSVTSRNGETVRGYVSDRVVWERPDFAAQVVSKALRDLRHWRDRYRSYQQLSGVVSKVDEALAETDELLDKAA